MFAVEVQDAQDRVVPITDNEVTFKVSGAGKLIGLGNGDPTDQDSDKGTSRKAFCGYCMAVVQSTKKGGSITVEATSPGLEPASANINAKAVEAAAAGGGVGARGAEGRRRDRACGGRRRMEGHRR